MSFLLPSSRSPKEMIQSRLMKLTVLFIFIGCLILTLAPAVRFHSFSVEYRWEQWVGFLIWFIGFSIIYNQINRLLPDHDPYLIPITGLLVGWGLLTIYRLDPAYGYRQTTWLAVCLLGLWIGMKIPALTNILRRYKYIWLTVGLLLTILTFFFGTYPGGTGPNLWLGCCGIYIQPSEFLKFLLIIYLSAYLADNLPVKFRLIQLVAPTLIVIGAALLILVAQRDLGTASLFIALYTVIIYLASGKRRVLLFSFLIVVGALVTAYFVFDVIQLRIEAWLNPWLDPDGRSYQIVQSILAIANGGIFGRGIGLGSPGVVPVSHSDFIYPSMIEETGLVGAVALIVLYGFITVRGYSISLHAPNQFQRFLAAGITTYLIVQTLLIMGGTIRLFPLTGVTLPFLSYGGSSLVTAFASILLLLIISNQSEDQPAVIYQSRSYLFIGTVFLTGFVAVILLTTWWSVIRGEDLLARNDNPRRFISDQYVQRGKILDRNNNILAETVGSPGTYQRVLNYPLLSSVIGYSNSNYGQAGLEANMDDTLRGVDENSFSSVFLHRLLYAQYPVGFDIRLSIDLSLQQTADTFLQSHQGGLVLLNADTGEILAMSSSPTFDSNKLNENWETYRTDKNSPLLNRVTQGQYPPGTILGGVILARTLSQSGLSTTSWEEIVTEEEINTDSCAIYPGSNAKLNALISSGCPGVISSLLEGRNTSDILNIYRESGVFTQWDITGTPMESNSVSEQGNLDTLLTGSSDLLVSPLQVAVTLASLSNDGKPITPRLVTAFQSSQGDWTALQQDASPSISTGFDLSAASEYLSEGENAGWEVLSTAQSNEGKVNWYAAGTPLNWPGTPLTIVVVLENSTPFEVQTIGRELMDAAINSVE